MNLASSMFFSSVQACVIDLMGGGAAEMVFLGDASPMFMMRVSLLVAAERRPAGRGNVLMNQYTPHGLRERADVARQAVK